MTIVSILRCRVGGRRLDSERGGLMRMKRMGGEGVFYKFLINIIPIEDMMKDVL